MCTNYIRLCTARYSKPSSKNIKDVMMHLSNYAINKHNDEYKKAQEDSSKDSTFEDLNDTSHKRSIRTLFKQLARSSTNPEHSSHPDSTGGKEEERKEGHEEKEKPKFDADLIWERMSKPITLSHSLSLSLCIYVCMHVCMYMYI